MKTKARRVDMWHRACLLLVLTGCARGALPPPATVPAGGAKPPADGVDTTSAAVEPDGEPTEKDAFRPVGVAPVKTAADSPATFWDDRDDLLDAPEPPQPRVFALPHATKTRLRNGLRVVMLPADEAQTEIIAHATLAVRAGVLDEPLDATGVAGFTASLLRRGTQDLSAQQIEQLLAQAGASFDVQVEDDLARLDCAVAADHLAVCLALLAQMVRTPLFPTPEMATLAGSVLESIQQRNSDPSSLGQDHLANLVFGDDHPLGRPLTAAALGRLTRAVVQDFWRAHYRPNNAVLVLTGAVNPADAGKLVAQHFSRWTTGAVKPRKLPAPPEREGRRVLLLDHPASSRALVLFGQPTPSRGAPDFAATTLLGRVLAGSDFASRLLVRLAVQMRISTDVASTLEAGVDWGWLRGGFSTPADKAIDGLLATVAALLALRDHGPGDAELQAARGYEAGAFPRGLQTSADLAGAVAAAEMGGGDHLQLGRWPSILAGVDARQATQVAGRVFKPESLVVVLVGNASVLAPALQKRGIVFERVGVRDPVSFFERAQRRSAEESVGKGGNRTARAVIIRALHEQGGAPKWRGLRGLKVSKRGQRRQGEATFQLHSTTHYQRPDRVRVEQTITGDKGEMKGVVVADPSGVWGADAEGKRVPLPKQNVARIRAALFEDVNFILLNILDADPPLPMQPIAPLADQNRRLQGVMVRVPSGDWLRLYFDPDTRLLVRILTTDADGSESEERLDDYRDVDGIKLPFRQTSATAGTVSAAEIIEAVLNPPVID